MHHSGGLHTLSASPGSHQGLALHACFDSNGLINGTYDPQTARMNTSSRPRLDELVQRIIDQLPSDLHQIKADLERNLRAALSSALARLELVTREEFDIQAALLARTRERLEQLQARIEELERRIRSDQSEPP